LETWAIATIAGAVAVLLVAGLALVIFRRTARRVLEAQEEASSQALQRVRDALDQAPIHERRSSESLLQLCTDLWRHLADLRITGDLLWYHTSREHLEAFVGALTKARVAADRGRMILTDNQYARLESLLDGFEAIELGGMLRLIDLRSGPHVDDFLRTGVTFLQEQLRRNSHVKRQFETLADEILRDLKGLLDLPREDVASPRVVPLQEARRADSA
jgi:hypothetical protein